MKHFQIISIVFLIIFCVKTSTSYKNVPIKISKVDDGIASIEQDDPSIKLIPMEIQSNHFNTSRSYVLGARQTGDVVVANINNKKSWPVAQNVTTTLTYPASGGNGAFLTYILINCEQSSNIGQAYVVYGGIHQHFIQIVIEARISTYFNYAAFFYGVK